MSQFDGSKTTVDDHGAVSIPETVREAAGIAPGDDVRWTVDEDGTVTLEVLEGTYGAFDDVDPVEGPDREPVDAVTDTDRTPEFEQ